MTVAVNVVVPEGLVFAADTRQTFRNERGDIKVSSEHARKVFQLTSKVAAVTWGWGFLTRRDINSLVEEFKLGLDTAPSLPVEEVARQLRRFFVTKYNQEIENKWSQPVPEGSYATGFLVGGYDPGETVGKVYECWVPGEKEWLIQSTDRPGANWRGMEDAISRLVKGYDRRLRQLPGFTPELEQELKKGPLDYLTYFGSMPLQDAIDYVIFLIRTTIEMQRFSDGILIEPGESAGCGGTVEVLVVRPQDGVRWIQQQELRGERAIHADLGAPT